MLLLVAAGRWDWSWAWLNVGVFAVFDVLSIVLVDPDLLVERTRRSADQKAWDKPLVGLAVALLPLLSLVIAGLDERWGWSAELAATVQGIAALAIIAGYGLTVWAMRVNAYFSAIVRIQTDRGHQVATGGPYRLVRHPGYVGAILFTLATPIMLDSWWALIPGVIARTPLPLLRHGTSTIWPRTAAAEKWTAGQGRASLRDGGEGMATFVLIHGGGDVGWYWHLVEVELRQRGHDVVAVHPGRVHGMCGG